MSLLHHPEAGKELGSQVQKGFFILSGTRMVPPWAHECDSKVYSISITTSRLLNVCPRLMEGQQPGLRAGVHPFLVEFPKSL